TISANTVTEVPKINTGDISPSLSELQSKNPNKLKCRQNLAELYRQQQTLDDGKKAENDEVLKQIWNAFRQC
ncbi:hypothetical protein Ocin01_11875, partial [Orchesella cincta]